jgi:N-acetylmuramoyl-L-alanine amidase
MKQKLYLITILISISCTNNFHKTNKIYKSKIKNLTQELSKPLYIKNYNNEIINKNWIGTVNFNLRKPNFVIIHCTKFM